MGESGAHSWKTVHLRDHICKPEYGFTTSATANFTGLKFLRITDIQDDKVEWETVPYCKCEINKERYLLKSGDIVVARIGATTGKTYLVENPPESIFASYLMRIRTKTDLLPEFLNLFFQTEDYWKQIFQNMGGRLKGGVNIPILQSLVLPFPSVFEQRAISHVLRVVQKARETRLHEIVLERERKAALMEHLFTHGTRGEPTKQTEIGEIPESWQELKLGDICSITTGTTPSTDQPEYYQGSIPFIKTSEITNKRIRTTGTYISEAAVEKFNLKRYLPGTVFLAMYGQGKTRGQVALLEISATTTQNTAAIVSNDELNSEFLWQWLMNQYDKLREAGSQGHISHLNLGYVKQYKTPLPPKSEQYLIASILNACDGKINILEHEAHLLDELFRAMLEELMTGFISTDGLVLENRQQNNLHRDGAGWQNDG